MRMTERELYNHVKRVYPNIIPKEGEDLNIQNALHRIVKKCWENKDGYPNIESIASVVGIGRRTIQNIAVKMNLSPRK